MNEQKSLEVIKAIEKNDINMVKFYIDNGYPLNGVKCEIYNYLEYQSTFDPDEIPEIIYENQPLIESIFRQNIKLVKLLLENGANPGLPGMTFDNALEIAKCTENEEIIKVIKAHLIKSSIV